LFGYALLTEFETVAQASRSVQEMIFDLWKKSRGNELLRENNALRCNPFAVGVATVEKKRRFPRSCYTDRPTGLVSFAIGRHPSWKMRLRRARTSRRRSLLSTLSAPHVMCGVEPNAAIQPTRSRYSVHAPR